MIQKPAPQLPAWLSARVPFKRYRVDVGDYHMHVMEVGEGRPVLLQHGNPTWGFLYRKVAQALTGEPLRLIMPDLVGLGFSDTARNPAEHTLDNHARWLGALIEQYNEPRWALVVQDWGGPIGTLALAHAKVKLDGMVVLNTVLRAPREGFKASAFHRFSHVPVVSNLMFQGLGFPQLHLGPAQGDPGSMSGEVGRAYRYPLRGWARRSGPLALTRMAPDRGGHPSVAALARCEAIVRGYEGPAALVWGRRDPVLARALKRTRELLPQASLTETQAGHFLQEEVPMTIAAALREVIAKSDN